MYMQFTMKLPGLEGVMITKMEERERNFYLHVKLPIKKQSCPACGKRFPENNQLVDRYQRHSKEWNQALGLRVIQGKNFKDTAGQFRTSETTAIRRFDQLAAPRLKEVDTLPRVIAIDEYKGDTTEGNSKSLLQMVKQAFLLISCPTVL